jgi:hypothetical protein
MEAYFVEDLNEIQEKLFHDFNLILEFNCPDSIKLKVLSTLFSINPNCWRVIGITAPAFAVFKQYGFKKVSGMKINRSHRFERKKTYEEMLEIGKGFTTPQDLWEYYWNRDETILATSSENLKNTSLDILIHVPQDERKLFRTRGFAWKHGAEEIAFLKAYK